MDNQTLQIDRQIFSVSDLTRNIRFNLEENFSNIWVEGEVSGFKAHSSGHFYFSLKDPNSNLQCVMFRRENQSLSFEMQEGLQVICFGRVSVYPPRGQYQLTVERIEPKGLGTLQLKFEQLKEKLRKEGFFDESHKKEIPYLPKTIGIVTSIDGAALRDILHVLDRRFPDVHILIAPVAVQGAGSAEAIAAAIQGFNQIAEVDVLIVGRGGGSIEDLWAFNEEIVARAIFNSQIPIISAVGHEVDFTIADFVADLRAATPSAAAEIVLPLKEDLVVRIAEFKTRLLQAFRGILVLPTQRLDELKKNLKGSLETLTRSMKERFLASIGKLEALGPLSVLKRGFSVTLKMPQDKIITSYKELAIGDNIKTKLSEGFFISKVTHKEKIDVTAQRNSI